MIYDIYHIYMISRYMIIEDKILKKGLNLMKEEQIEDCMSRYVAGFI